MSADDGVTPFDQLLEYLKHDRGFDFTGYKRATLERRIEKRRQATGAGGLGEYLELLQREPAEYEQLFNTILINVTDFFRDDVPWEFLASDVVPRLLERSAQGIRVWSAGCATGQEAYSLAMLLADALGPDAFRERVKIYATDVDDEALAAGRAGAYSEKDVQHVSPERLERYFEAADGRYVFRKDLRRTVIFGRNDLVQDAPISKVDLLVCRNTLMYFDAETQAKILVKFHFALRDQGYLFLGRAETLMTHLRTFTPVDLKRRVFMKIARPTLDDRLLLASRRAIDDQGQAAGPGSRLRDAALVVGTNPQVIVDRQGVLSVANERANALFRLAAADIGRPLQDLELSYRPVELRGCIEQAYAERRTITRLEVEWRVEGELRWFDVQVSPLVNTGGQLLGASVEFVDVTAPRQLQTRLQQAAMELETAYEELQSTNEELETTNEELQATVEELETTNEELQSTNEELETMNQELQATNEELQTMNDELRRRGDELDDVNSFLESVFTSVRAGLVVVDRDLSVLVWNKGAEDLWGLRGEEVEGRPLLNLDIGLPIEQLKMPLRATVAGDVPSFERAIPAINRRGRPITCRVNGNPLISAGDGDAPRGAILIMTADDGASGQSITAGQE